MPLSSALLLTLMFAKAIVSPDNVQACFESSPGCRGPEGFPSKNFWNITAISSSDGCWAIWRPTILSSIPCNDFQWSMRRSFNRNRFHVAMCEFVSSKFSALRHPILSSVLASMISPQQMLALCKPVPATRPNRSDVRVKWSDDGNNGSHFFLKEIVGFIPCTLNTLAGSMCEEKTKQSEICRTWDVVPSPRIGCQHFHSSARKKNKRCTCSCCPFIFLFPHWKT